MKVDSKFENPDRYIKRLKVKCDELREAARAERHKPGNFLFNYLSSETHKFIVTDRSLGDCCTQQRLIVEGRICHVEENCESSEVTIDKITVKMKDDL